MARYDCYTTKIMVGFSDSEPPGLPYRPASWISSRVRLYGSNVNAKRFPSAGKLCVSTDTASRSLTEFIASVLGGPALFFNTNALAPATDFPVSASTVGGRGGAGASSPQKFEGTGQPASGPPSRRAAATARGDRRPAPHSTDT